MPGKKNASLKKPDMYEDLREEVPPRRRRPVSPMPRRGTGSRRSPNGAVNPRPTTTGPSAS